MRRGGTSCSGCRVLKVLADYPFPLSLSSSSFSPLLRRWGSSPPAIRARSSRRARVEQWSGVVERGGGGRASRRPFVNITGRDFLCPSRSGWIGSPSGFIDSFTAFPMLPSPLWCVCMVCGRPGIEDPIGLPPYWCPDSSVHCDIRGGVGPLGRDLIATPLAVAIRVVVATPCSVAARDVAVPFPVAMVSRWP
ncbi:hypothetical protein Taro_048816 [Colocasia esculenta]|uniref:Uncharacterized protein n=1 Tax=Colocasia esculenta TaxID=4460 RepID=A0A843X970_COLES|nr:hypothetical protein [Colocasia esculenta]